MAPVAPTSLDVPEPYHDASPTLRRSVSSASLRSLEHFNDSFLEPERPQPRPGFWTRLQMSIRRRHRTAPPRDEDFGQVRLPVGEAVPTRTKPRSKRKLAAKACVVIPLLVILFFGIVHILDLSFGYVPTLRDQKTAASINQVAASKIAAEMTPQVLDVTRDVTPINCHSHNDYWRKVPLYDALRWGCTGVEADVWLFNDEPFVGHDTRSLTKDKTLRSMYVDPLVKMLDHRNNPSNNVTTSSTKNGIFQTDPSQTLVLLVDFKNDGPKIWPYVVQQLSALREKGYLSYYNGKSVVRNAITVVATGNAPFDLVTANSTYRDIFFDAPLDRLYVEPAVPGKNSLKASNPSSGSSDNEKTLPKSAAAAILHHRRGGQGDVGTMPDSHFDATNSYYASVNFGKSIGWLWFGHVTKAQRALIRGQIQGAHDRGVKARYWSTPKWPVALKNKVWRILVEEGVDYLNGDDLQAMTSLDWSRKGHWGVLG